MINPMILLALIEEERILEQEELEQIRQQSDAPTLILMSILAFVFIISQFFEEIN